MSLDDVISAKMHAHCTQEPEDTVRVGRVGLPNTPLSMVAIDLMTLEPYTDDAHTGGTVLLTPAMARQFAVAMIDFADECQGTFTSFFTDYKEGDDGAVPCGA